MTTVDTLRVVYELNDRQYQQGVQRMRALGETANNALVNSAKKAETATEAVGSAFGRVGTQGATALRGLEDSFDRMRGGAVKMTADVSKALDAMGTSSGPKRLEQALDAIIAKQRIVVGGATAMPAGGAMPAGLPGLGGGASPVVIPPQPDPFKAPNEGADRMKQNLGNIAAQFNDIGVTAAMGMNPMLIALQQGTQLSQVFAGQKTGDVVKGLGAAFASIVSPISLATLAAVAVASALVQFGVAALAAGRDSKSFADSLKGARDALENLREAIATGKDIEDLRERYGALTTQIWGLVEAQKALAELDARKVLTELGQSFKELTEVNPSRWQLDAGIAPAVVAAERLASQLKITDEEAMRLYQSITTLNTAKTPQDIADAYTRVRETLMEIINSQDKSSSAALEMAGNVAEGESTARQLLNVLGLVPGALDSATASASGLTNEIMRAVNAAAQLANAGLSDLRRAEIEANFRTDPVGKAGALAAQRFDETVGKGVGMDAGLFNTMRRQTIERAEATARLTQETQKLNEADREAERLANRKGKKGGGAKTSPEQRAVERFDDRIKKEIQGLQAEAEALTRLAPGYDEYGNAVAAARKEAELLQDLQNKGVQITPELAAQVRQLTLDWYEVADAADTARERHAEFQQNLESFRSAGESAFSGLISGAESFSSAIGKVIQKLADMAASSAFDGLWQMGLGALGLGRGDPLSSALAGAGLRPRGFSSGGYTGSVGTNRVAGVVHGGEYVMSAPAVNRIGLPALERLHRGGSVGGSYSFNPTIHVGGSVTQDDIARIHQVMEVERKNFVQSVRKAQSEIGQRYS